MVWYSVEEENASVSLSSIYLIEISLITSNTAVPIKIDEDEIEVVDSFIYLGSLIKSNSDVTPEKKRRIALGRSAMVNMDKLWKCKGIKVATKCRLIHMLQLGTPWLL